MFSLTHQSESFAGTDSMETFLVFFVAFGAIQVVVRLIPAIAVMLKLSITLEFELLSFRLGRYIFTLLS